MNFYFITKLKDKSVKILICLRQSFNVVTSHWDFVTFMNQAFCAHLFVNIGGSARGAVGLRWLSFGLFRMVLVKLRALVKVTPELSFNWVEMAEFWVVQDGVG
ncbi:hypothetical protein CsSME_00048941 [Camellia sinensis var. sinensis]